MKKLLLTANHKFILVNVLFSIMLLTIGSIANAATYCNPTYPNSGNGSGYGFSNITIGTINDNPNSTWNTHDKTATSFNATAGQTLTISVTTTGWLGFGVAGDWNNDGDFNDTDEILFASGNPGASSKTFTQTITIPAWVAGGSYRIRFWNRAGNATKDQVAGNPCDNYSTYTSGTGPNNGLGTWVDYTVNISPSCTGTPTPGSVASPLVLCAASNSFVLKTNSPLVSGVTGQWEQSTTGVSGWTNLSGATTNPYTVTGGIVSPMYYRFKVTCTASGLSAYSNVITVTTTTGTYAFGDNEWITYGFNSQYTHTQYKDINNVFTNYKGYYYQKLDVALDYGFNTTKSWNAWDSPSKSAVAFNNGTGSGSIWYGCSDALGIAAWNGSNYTDGRQQYTYISKRKGFPTGNYKMTLPKWDDDTYIFVNGVRLSYAGEYDGTNNAWGTNATIKNCIYLDANSTVEVRSNANGSPNSVIFKIEKVSTIVDIDGGAGSSICHGINVTLNGTNTSNISPLTHTWSGAGIVSGGSTLTPVVAPTTTTTYKLVSKYEMCADSSTVTITLPFKTDVISANNESATCQVSGNNPIHFYHTGTGHYIGSINPKGRNGTLTMTSYIATFSGTAGNGDGTMYACNKPSNENYRTAYMERSFVIKQNIALNSSGNVEVYFPFTDTEFSNLKSKSTSLTTVNTYDNVSTLSDISATKFDASAGNSSFENNTPLDNCGKGTSVVVAQTASGNLAGSTPFTLPQTIPATNNYHYAMFQVANFSEFNLHGKNLLNGGAASPLPIELLSFTATPNNRQVDLAWQTATETNNNYFEVEKTINGTDWEFVCKQNGAGNSTTMLSYTDVDKNPYMGTSYYRLKQVDFDGQYTYSQIETVNFNGQSETIVYPNPNKGDFTVKMIAETAGNTTIKLFDNLGKILVSQENTTTKGVNFWNISTTDLPNGIYFLQIQNKDNEVIKLEIAH
jgi:hypothetical protein